MMASGTRLGRILAVQEDYSVCAEWRGASLRSGTLVDLSERLGRCRRRWGYRFFVAAYCTIARPRVTI
jgi:hypothetical protein